MTGTILVEAFSYYCSEHYGYETYVGRQRWLFVLSLYTLHIGRLKIFRGTFARLRNGIHVQPECTYLHIWDKFKNENHGNTPPGEFHDVIRLVK
jgi:hypothetical protein